MIKEMLKQVGNNKYTPVFFMKAGEIIEGRLLKIKRSNKLLIEYNEDGRRKLITKRINSLKGLLPDELSKILRIKSAV